MNTHIIPLVFGFLVVSMTVSSVSADSEIYLTSPLKQQASGISADNVVCNIGLTLVTKLSTGSSVCVKPTSALKLEKLGWGQILKQHMMTDDARQMMIEKIISNKINYNPSINPDDFTTNITNPYVSLPVGKQIIFDSNTKDGVERIEILVTDETKNVMGVETVVYWDRVWIEGVLLEDTRDWLAQDKEGNVWYFGEDVDNYSNGVLIDHAGSWEAGVDGAKPGIWMVTNPQVGELYRQEYYVDHAEDLALILSLDESVTVEFGTFSGCLKTQDWTPLEPGVYEHKYYCTQVGNMVLEEKPSDDEIVELIDVQYDQFIPSESESTHESTPSPALPLEITADKAKAIAQNAVSGTAIGVGIEYKFGEFAWVVEIMTSQGEQDVVISKTTGEVLGIEN